MNISAINYANTTHRTSFGQSENMPSVELAESIANSTKQLADNFESSKKDDNKKSPVATAVSVAGAIATTYMLGKAAAATAMNMFPKAPDAMGKAARKGTDFVKRQAGKMASKNVKVIPTIGKGVEKATTFVDDKATALFNKFGTEKILMNVAGGAAALIAGGQVVSVDSNQDGVRDITDKNINAYKAAAQNMNILNGIIETLA